MLDRAIWATWYDVEPEEMSGFLAWMHGSFLPELASERGLAWVAHYRSHPGGEDTERIKASILRRPQEDIGSGTQFMLLAGAASPYAFFDTQAAMFQREPRAPELGRCKGIRNAIFVEEARVSGPASAGHGPEPAAVIQFGSFRIRSVAEEFQGAEWYARTRLPFMERTPGCVRTRKLSCVAGWVKHGILYEFVSAHARIENFERPQEAKALTPEKHWSVAKVSIHAPGSPTVGSRIWPPLAGPTGREIERGT